MQHQVALAKLAMRSRSTLFENLVEIIPSGVIQGILTSQSADPRESSRDLGNLWSSCKRRHDDCQLDQGCLVRGCYIGSDERYISRNAGRNA